MALPFGSVPSSSLPFFPWDRMPTAFNSSSRLHLRSSWLVKGRGSFLKAARRKNLRQFILNLAAFHEEEALSGTEYQSHGGQRTIEPKWNIDRLMAFGEGICIAASAAACIASFIANRPETFALVASSTPTAPVNSRLHAFSTWQVIPLLIALVINIVLRSRRWQGKSTFLRRSEDAAARSVLNQRISKLEEDVGSAVTIIRMLSRQIEKLGVRFRVTRQTLRDPIQETAVLAQKTAETVSGLIACEGFLEEEIKEIQHVLLAMQENQVKQLELISSLGKAFRQSPIRKNDGSLTEEGSKKGLHLGQQGYRNQDFWLSKQNDINHRTDSGVTTQAGHKEAQNMYGVNNMSKGHIDGAE